MFARVLILNYFRLIFCLMMFAVIVSTANASSWKVQINGNKVYSESFLIKQLDLPAEMDVISPDRRNFIIKLAKGNLDEFYQSNGYFSVNVSLTMNEELFDSTIVENYIFNIQEGDRYKFGHANIVLAEGSDSLIGTDKLSVTKGDFYDTEQITNDRKAIRDIYQKNGYLHITIEHLEYIDTIAKKVDVHYYTDPKTQVIMGNFKSIAFRSGLMPGQTEPETGLSNANWLNELWEIQRDSIVNEKYFFSFRSKLFSTQLFSQVRLEDTLQENGLSDITLTVYERVPGEANYGFFFEQQYGFGVSFSALHRNMFGSFHEIGLGSILAENKQELYFTYAHPLLFGTRVSWIPTAIRLDEKISFNHENLPDPTNPDDLVERWEILNRATLSFGLSNYIRTRNTLDFKFLRKRSDEPKEDFFKIKGEVGLIFDFTDNSYDPTLGIKLTPSFGAGGVLENESFQNFKKTKNLSDLLNIGLSNGFTYVDASTYLYIPLKRRLLLSAFAFSYGNIFNNAPIDDAWTFYQGGGRTLRGYRFRTVYPSKINNDVLVCDNSSGECKPSIEGGLSPQYFRINEELRFIPPVSSLRNFQIVQFTDWVYINDSDKSFNSDRQASVGMGLRYKWQFLTVRLDYALKTEFKNFKPDKFSFSHIVFDLSQAI